MKPIYPFAFLGALLAVGAVNAATTDPVGYITHTIAGSGPAASADTFISASLIQPTVFAGQSSASPSGSTTISFASGVPTDLDSTYVLEITSGASEGWWSTVISSTATSIVVNDAFPNGLPADVTVSVRKHTTLKNFLGDNEPGLITFNGVDANDEVQVLNPIAQSVKAFAYVSAADLGEAEGAWFDLGLSVTANDFVIEPGTSIKIKRVGDDPLTFTSTGTVKTTKTQVDLFTNFNWVGTPLAAGGTLNGMTFNDQLVKFDGVNPNYDELQFVRANQVVEPFAAIDDVGGATMFNLTTSSVAGDEPFVEGTGVIINHIGNPPAVITLPGSVVAP